MRILLKRSIILPFELNDIQATWINSDFMAVKLSKMVDWSDVNVKQTHKAMHLS